MYGILRPSTQPSVVVALYKAAENTELLEHEDH